MRNYIENVKCSSFLTQHTVVRDFDSCTVLMWSHCLKCPAPCFCHDGMQFWQKYRRYHAQWRALQNFHPLNCFWNVFACHSSNKGALTNHYIFLFKKNVISYYQCIEYRNIYHIHSWILNLNATFRTITKLGNLWENHALCVRHVAYAILNFLQITRETRYYFHFTEEDMETLVSESKFSCPRSPNQKVVQIELEQNVLTSVRPFFTFA